MEAETASQNKTTLLQVQYLKQGRQTLNSGFPFGGIRKIIYIYVRKIGRKDVSYEVELVKQDGETQTDGPCVTFIIPSGAPVVNLCGSGVCDAGLFTAQQFGLQL
jgi:hypothetical protein